MSSGNRLTGTLLSDRKAMVRLVYYYLYYLYILRDIFIASSNSREGLLYYSLNLCSLLPYGPNLLFKQ